MTEIFLTDNLIALKQMRSGGLDVHLFTEQLPPLQGRKVTFVSADDAKSKAMGLVARGLSDHHLSYAQISPDGFGAIPLGDLTKHLYWDDVRPLSACTDEGDEGQNYPSGLGFLDKNLGFRWRIPELCICAGPYGSGKSLLAQILAMEFASGAGRALGSGAMLCAWEDLVGQVRKDATKHQLGKGCNDLLDRIHFVRRHPDEDRLISWYMDLVRYHRTRYGTRFFVLDPWNELDHVKDSRQAETDYIRDMMKAFRRLVDKLQIILIIVTHVPAKNIRGNGEIEPFKIAHAFGSVQFANKADRGLCVVRTKKFGQQAMVIRQDKSKVESVMGAKGTVAARYVPQFHALEFDSYITQEVQDVWKD